MPPYLSVQGPQQVRQPSVTVGLQPFLASLDTASQLLLGRPAPHPRRPLAVSLPVKLETEKGEPPFAARMESTEAVDAGFLRGHRQTEFVQPFGEHPVKCFRFSLILEGADKVIRVADDVCLSLAAWFHHPLKPQVQRVVEVDVRQYRRNHSALRCPGVGMMDRAVPFQYPSLEPGVDQPEKRFVVNPLFQHPQQPVMVYVVEEAVDVGFHNVSVPAELQLVTTDAI